jgi:dTDP-4-dehydrorhamnose reductase
VTNAGECTWFEFASAIVQQAGLATTVRPMSSEKMARPAPRPAYSVLSPKSLQRLKIEMPTWDDSLPRYLQQRNS